MTLLRSFSRLYNSTVTNATVQPTEGTVALLRTGVIGRSLKENEKRVAVHPAHLPWISEDIRQNLFFERGYGEPFGVDDGEILRFAGGVADRREILEESDIAVIPKPMQADFDRLRRNGILWGWAHVVQQTGPAQAAIDRRLTLITWESMNTWTPGGDWQSHIFYKNNEIAGYAGVQHALALTGTDGNYGPDRRVAVINFGSVSRGAVYALVGRGFTDITVYTLQPASQVPNQVTGIRYRGIVPGASGRLTVQDPDGVEHLFIEDLTRADIIVNGILQDPDAPFTFVATDEVDALKKGCLIIDISCDEGMGFPFARPTTFEEPIFEVGRVRYYAVDHTPSYLWDSASWEISAALLPFLRLVMGGPDSWESSETIRRAIEIRDGVVRNPKILSFQKRSADHPHPVTG